jgi:hypothetical protein
MPPLKRNGGVGLIYLDACIVIYLVERHSRWGEPVARATAQAAEGRFGVSPLLERAYVEFLERFVQSGIPEAVYLQAARRRSLFGLKTPDALTSPAFSTMVATLCGRMTTGWRRRRTVSL